MTEKKARKTKQLPKYGTLDRKSMVPLITILPSYKKSLEEGHLFFTNEELDALENRYKEGLTWDDIDRELRAKRIFLKKVTFRKYIQDGYLPKAIKYRNTDKRRMAVFPSDTIAQINFIQCFRKVDVFKELFEMIKDLQVTGLDEVESKLSSDDGDIRFSIHTHLPYGACEASDAIQEGLADRPEDQQKAIAMLDEIVEAYGSIIEQKIDELVSFLEEIKIRPFLPVAKEEKEADLSNTGKGDNYL